MNRFTYTTTRFFDDRKLAVLREQARMLQSDFDERSRFIEARVVEAGQRRLRLFDAAIELLGERVAE